MIDRDITAFLTTYSDDLLRVNRIIVATYVQFNNVTNIKNKLLSSYLRESDEEQVKHFISLIRRNSSQFGLENLIQLFEVTIPSGNVTVNGAIYTPHWVKDYIIRESFNRLAEKNLLDVRFADVSCGTGAFLYTIAEQLRDKTGKSFYDIFRQNVFGLDISDYAIERAKIVLILLAKHYGEDHELFEFNLLVGNALAFDWKDAIPSFKGFDAVVGNPPYVRAKHLDEQTKALMVNWKVTKTGNPDLYIPFFEIGIKHLKDHGILGYITVNTFKRSVNARSLREYFKSNRFDISILDFGNQQIFENRSTYTCIVFIRNCSSNSVHYYRATPSELVATHEIPFSRINYKLLDNHKGWIMSDNTALNNIRRIENAGISLGDKYPIRNGLATLSNDTFIFKPVDEDENFYYHQNGKLHRIEKAICKDIIKPNRLKTEEEIPVLTEKIIFPYYCDEGQLNMFAGKPQKQRVLDECVFRERFPNAYQYLEQNKTKLLNRDKGKDQKYKWFEYGRTQALADYGKKLLFPYMSDKPYFVFTDQKDLLLYAGYAIYSDSDRELKVLKRILESKIFWYYIQKTSKPYGGNFFALAKNYVKDFSICELTENEENFLLETNSPHERDEFLFDKYKFERNI